MDVDRRLTWAKNVKAKRNQLNLKVKKNALRTLKINTIKSK
jgi:hypothetical protein